MVFRPGDIANPTGKGGLTAGGPSPNPKGRPKGAQQVQNRALELCGEALDTLAEIMRGRADKSIVSAQIAACSLILDRGCGKAGQSLAIAVDLKRRISELSHEELLQLREKYVAAVGGPSKLIEYNENEMEGHDN
jgi:hypothetical protein